MSIAAESLELGLCECGCGEETNPLWARVHELRARGLTYPQIALRLQIDAAYAKQLGRIPRPRYLKGHSGKAAVWAPRACSYCGRVSRAPSGSRFCFGNSPPCAHGRSVFRSLRAQGLPEDTAEGIALVGARDLAAALEERELRRQEELFALSTTRYWLRAERAAVRSARRQERAATRVWLRAERRRARELETLQRRQERDARRMRIGYFARPSLNEPIRGYEDSGGEFFHIDIVEAPRLDVDEWIAQSTASTLLSMSMPSPLARSAIVKLRNGGSLDEHELAELRTLYKASEARLLRLASIPGTRQHEHTDGRYEGINVGVVTGESAPRSEDVVGMGEGHLNRGRGRGHHGSSPHLQGRKRFEGKAQVALDRAVRRQRKVPD